ncbi:MAG TPA: SpoIIE family protein phosphatase [Candidatus Acidoferrales bacterium]|nr:SpoIIE family protein phosphatase [Candidatus Acidoferrales bacterium]
MAEKSSKGEVGVEVIAPGGSRRFVRIEETPFLIGRSGETAKHLQLKDPRISRQCAAIVTDGEHYILEDRGQRHGIFINREKISRQELQDGDVISFGVENFYELMFQSSLHDTSIPELLSRIENITSSDAPAGGLRKLTLLLEATSLLHSRLPLEAVLGTMLDHAISVTDADRGYLLEPMASGPMRLRLGRGRGGTRLSTAEAAPSQTALQQAIAQQESIITEDLAQGGGSLQVAESIIAQRLRAVVVIPLYAMSRASTTDSAFHQKRGEFLGVVYLDSRRPAAFSNLDRQILDALGVEAASILDNARLVERERERERMEQQLAIARDIQQALLPRGLRDFPHMGIKGINLPCLTVGGDYFDVFSLGPGRTAFIIADVSGKGLGAALLTTMLQGALSGIRMGIEPLQVFKHINSFLCEHEEVERYATMFLGILGDDGQFDFINAGHPSPFLLRRGGIDEPCTEGSFPVGLMPDAEYVPTQMKLSPGDTLVLFSDGVTEAMDPDDNLYGGPRLRDALADLQEASLDHVQTTVLASIEAFTRGAAQADDITLLLVRYRG